MCRKAQLEARAEDMRDQVTKLVEMALIRYSSQITEMEVRKQPDWQRSGGKRRRGAERAPRGPQTKENPAVMRAGRVNGVASKGDSWGRQGPEGKRKQCRPSHRLEHPGMGALSR